MKKRITFFICLTLVFCLLAVEASAAILDSSRKGSITINTSYKGSPVSGGTLTLYRAAKVESFRFVLLDEFVQSGVLINDVSSAQTAKLLADYAASEKIEGTKQKIKNASVLFDDLEQGVYLLVQHDPAPGYEKMNPFLVTVPMVQNDE